MNLKTLKGETYKGRLLLDYLRSLTSIRSSCEVVYSHAVADELLYFNFDADKLETVADLVIEVTRQQYPNLQVPPHSRWRHLESANINRLSLLNDKVPKELQAKSAVELAIVSVLLDAGAGSSWQYFDCLSDSILTKSEGLAAASFNLFMLGLFSSNSNNLYQVDALGLQNISEEVFASGLQMSDKNILLGLGARLNLLQSLGVCIQKHPDYFSDYDESPRLGNIVDYWLSKQQNNSISMTIIFATLLDAFAEIWPGRYLLDEINLGDVWPYTLTQNNLNPIGYIPFHKLTQWLCYSLIEPLQNLGLTVTDLDKLTGLPEYRNGGLFVDMQVLVPKNRDMYNLKHSVGSEFIVEWRAMTVALLDKLAIIIREKLELNSEQLPLASILQGGTWLAGRLVAAKLRPDASPPFKIDSDGTVF